MITPDLHPQLERRVLRTLRGRPTSDGAGVKLTRIIGQPALGELDPFLLLDEFRSDAPSEYLAGFPEHPHRGFETVTYMLAGRMRHADSQGNAGVLEPGGIQWMTAGRGILHSEMPEQRDGLLWGFQLWVNLPAAEKGRAPRYQDVGADRIAEVRAPGAAVRVLVGAFGTAVGPVRDVATDPTYLDVRLEPGAELDVPLPAGHRAFAYVYDGGVRIGPQSQTGVRGELAILSDGTHVRLNGEADGARLLLVAGRPLGEPIARYGPIVMNTEAELQAAFDDLRNGRFA